MDQLWRRLIHLYLITQLQQLCNCLPIASPSQGSIEWQWTSGLLALTVTVCIILVVIGCLCCQHRKGFQEFTNTSVAASAGSLVGTDLEQGNDPGLVNPIAAITASNSEFTIFRPLSPTHHNNNVVLAAPQSAINRAALGAKRITEIDFQPSDDVNHWFDESEVNFPRNKLKYVKELGRGWFGRVIAGEAVPLNDEHQVSSSDDTTTKTIPVVVRVLEANAGPRERAQFLREARIYYHTSHPNIMPLHGRCLEVPPFLLIQPYYSQGDLKKYLRDHNENADDFSDKTFLLRLCWELTNAVEYLSQRNISHPDLALRNCQLSDQMSLCLGDYGHSPQLYPEDYYPGTPPVPVRWCAPENVICTQTTIQPKSVTCFGNVWSLGVVFWEIISFGKQPYESLSDDDVVTLVLEKQQTILDEPQTPLPYTHNIYQLSRLCCSNLETRPPITQVQSMLSILLQSNDTLNAHACEPVSDSEFLARWNSLKPNTIVKTDNHPHTPEHSSATSVSTVVDATNDHPLQIDISPPTNSDKTLSVNSTVHYDTKQLSPASTINSDCFINDISTNRPEKSLSLTNLHGSLENLITATDDQNISKQQNTNPFMTPDEKKITSNTTEQNTEYESWLENIASQNKEDLSYVKGLSQAMQELDSALALEKSSSSSETSHQPSPGPESWTDQQKQQIPLVSHTKIDFKLGPLTDSTIPDTIHHISSEPDSLLDSILHPRSNSSSETEDETWRKRIERGAYSEKVRIKSKSVADLMVLTHIDTDTDSETPFPSLDYKSKMSLKSNFLDSIVNKPYGSEGNLNVVHDTFQEELKKLQEARRDSLLFVPLSDASVTNDSNSESQNKTTIICDHSSSLDRLDNVPSLNIINASTEDLSIIEDLNHPFHVFLQKRESNDQLFDNNRKSQEVSSEDETNQNEEMDSSKEIEISSENEETKCQKIESSPPSLRSENGNDSNFERKISKNDSIPTLESTELSKHIENVVDSNIDLEKNENSILLEDKSSIESLETISPEPNFDFQPFKMVESFSHNEENVFKIESRAKDPNLSSDIIENAELVKTDDQFSEITSPALFNKQEDNKAEISKNVSESFIQNEISAMYKIENGADQTLKSNGASSDNTKLVELEEHSKAPQTINPDENLNLFSTTVVEEFTKQPHDNVESSKDIFETGEIENNTLSKLQSVDTLGISEIDSPKQSLSLMSTPEVQSIKQNDKIEISNNISESFIQTESGSKVESPDTSNLEIKILKEETCQTETDSKVESRNDMNLENKISKITEVVQNSDMILTSIDDEHIKQQNEADISKKQTDDLLVNISSQNTTRPEIENLETELIKNNELHRVILQRCETVGLVQNLDLISDSAPLINLSSSSHSENKIERLGSKMESRTEDQNLVQILDLDETPKGGSENISESLISLSNKPPSPTLVMLVENEISTLNLEKSPKPSVDEPLLCFNIDESNSSRFSEISTSSTAKDNTISATQDFLNQEISYNNQRAESSSTSNDCDTSIDNNFQTLVTSTPLKDKNWKFESAIENKSISESPEEDHAKEIVIPMMDDATFSLEPKYHDKHLSTILELTENTTNFETDIKNMNKTFNIDTNKPSTVESCSDATFSIANQPEGDVLPGNSKTVNDLAQTVSTLANDDLNLTISKTLPEESSLDSTFSIVNRSAEDVLSKNSKTVDDLKETVSSLANDDLNLTISKTLPEESSSDTTFSIGNRPAEDVLSKNSKTVDDLRETVSTLANDSLDLTISKPLLEESSSDTTYSIGNRPAEDVLPRNSKTVDDLRETVSTLANDSLDLTISKPLLEESSSDSTFSIANRPAEDVLSKNSKTVDDLRETVSTLTSDSLDLTKSKTLPEESSSDTTFSIGNRPAEDVLSKNSKTVDDFTGTVSTLANDSLDLTISKPLLEESSSDTTFSIANRSAEDVLSKNSKTVDDLRETVSSLANEDLNLTICKRLPEESSDTTFSIANRPAEDVLSKNSKTVDDLRETVSTLANDSVDLTISKTLPEESSSDTTFSIGNRPAEDVLSKNSKTVDDLRETVSTLANDSLDLTISKPLLEESSSDTTFSIGNRPAEDVLSKNSKTVDDLRETVSTLANDDLNLTISETLPEESSSDITFSIANRPAEDVLSKNSKTVDDLRETVSTLANDSLDLTISKPLLEESSSDTTFSIASRSTGGILSNNSKTVNDLENRTIDLAQTVSNLANDSLDLTIPKRPPEFNVMRFEVIPQYNFESSNVILGPCDDYTLDLYTGLKTTYVDQTDEIINEDELYHFSTNFSTLNAEIKSTDSNTSSDMFLNKVPPVTPDLSSIITPCDSLEEHAMNTTFALKNQAEQIVNNVINDAEKIVRGKLSDERNNKYDFVPEIRNVIDEIIYKAECFVAEKLMQTSFRSDYFDGSDTIETPQLDSLEFNANSMLDSSSSLNKTVILRDSDKTLDVPNNLAKYESSYTLHSDVAGYSLELGWFLHPSNTNQHELPPIEGTIEDNESPPTSDNSYVGFSLDEECVAALRNELAAKLPHAQGPSIEPETQDEWECEPSTSEQHDEVILRYNVFAAPLSPIAEESEEFDCPTPETTPCREDSDSECEWSGGCFDPCDTDTRTPRAGSPNAAGRRSSRHRHTPSMDSCCSNDTLFNIEDINGVNGEGDPQKCNNNDSDAITKAAELLNNESESESEQDKLFNDKIEELMTQEISKVTIVNNDSQEENPTNEIEAFDTSDVYPSSTERIEAEPSTQEINSDYFSPTRNDFLSQEPSFVETKNSKSERQINSLKLEKKIISPTTLITEHDLNKKNELLINGEIIINQLEQSTVDNDSGNMFVDIENRSVSEKLNETYTLSDILQHLDESKIESNGTGPEKSRDKSNEAYTMSDILKHLDDASPKNTVVPELSTSDVATSSNSTLSNKQSTSTSDFLDLKFDFNDKLVKLTDDTLVVDESPIFHVKSLAEIATDVISSKHFLYENITGLKNGENSVQTILDICQTSPLIKQLKNEFIADIMMPPPVQKSKESQLYANLIDSHEACAENMTDTKPGDIIPTHSQSTNDYVNVDAPQKPVENSGIETPLYASIQDCCEPRRILIREDSIDSLIDEKEHTIPENGGNVLYENLKKNSPVPINIYENIPLHEPVPKKIVTKKTTSNHNSFDDDSVLKFYENIPTSPVHDDKIIESLYENIDKVNDTENFEKLFGLSSSSNNGTGSDKKLATQNLYENVKSVVTDDNLPTSYHKLYENIEKSKDFPYENRFDRGTATGIAGGNDSIDNSQSENGGHHDSADDTYDKVYTVSEDLYSDITDIRFSGPCDTQLMSTSFSDPHGGSDDQDWDSGSESRSSSSGEFVWKEGEHEASVRVLQAPSANDEKQITNENHSGLSTPDDDSCSTSSGEDGEGLEFVPSAWDSQAAPLKSALRSPDKTVDKCDRKRRGVWFKKQKYHCVYEYPREPDFSPPEWTAQPPYNSGIWGTPTASDLSSFADWELDTENVLDDGSSGSLGSSSQDFDLDDDTVSSRYTRRDYFRRPGDLYRLADVVPDIDFTTGLSVTDDDFYVTSSSKPFQSSSSQFFPGQIQYMTSSLHENTKTCQTAMERERTNSILEFANDLKKLHSLANNISNTTPSSSADSQTKGESATPDSGVEDITPASISAQSPDVTAETADPVNTITPTSTPTPTPTPAPIITHNVVSSLKTLAENSLKQSKLEKKRQDACVVMGGLRHTRDRLKLDLPPSPTSFSANRIFNLDVVTTSDTTTCSSHREREPPTFTTFGKTRFSVKHVDTPTEEVDINIITNTMNKMSIHALNNSTTELLTNEQSSPRQDDACCDGVVDCIEPSMLINSKRRRSVEIVRGEASLLDSADEDSGIESSANATLERQSSGGSGGSSGGSGVGICMYTDKDLV